MKIKEQAKRELKKLEKIYQSANEFLDQAPRGFLKCQKKKELIYYYHQYKVDTKKSWIRKYINKNDFSLAKNLAQKHYAQAVKPIIEKNLKILKQFIGEYHPEEIEKIYDDLPSNRKILVDPYQISREERIRRWQQEEYEKNESYPENLRYETMQGEYVRSKSELIIADILYQHRNDILYKYERPLCLIMDGREKTIYPDFTILNINTGEIVYWEHAGLMNDPHYADGFVKKMNTYISNGLRPGKDVLFSYESVTNPLEIGVIRKMVEDIIISNY